MAKRKSGKKKQGTAWWQWIIIAIAAFGVYKVMDHYLAEPDSRPAKKAPVKISQAKNKISREEKCEPETGSLSQGAADAASHPASDATSNSGSHSYSGAREKMGFQGYQPPAAARRLPG